MLAGRMRHRDNAGNEGLLGAGDVQWMTGGARDRAFGNAGAGARADGRFQLWLNLPHARRCASPVPRHPGRADPVVRHRGRRADPVDRGRPARVEAAVSGRTPIPSSSICTCRRGRAWISTFRADTTRSSTSIEGRCGSARRRDGRGRADGVSRTSPEADGVALACDVAARAILVAAGRSESRSRSTGPS